MATLNTKTIRMTLALAASIGGAGTVLAQSLLLTPASEAAASPLHGWQLGAVVSAARYSEPGLMKLEGQRLGVMVGRQVSSFDRWQTHFQGGVQSSAMRYTSPISGELSQAPDHELDLRLTALHVTDEGSGLSQEPIRVNASLGLGYRLNYNDLRGTTSRGHVGYRRLNQRLYVPLGLALQAKDLPGVTLRMEYLATLKGTHTTYMTDLGATQDATVDQKSRGWGLQATWQPSAGWFLSAYHRQWRSPDTSSWQSTVNGITRSYTEPANSWREAGVKIVRQF